jgi:hypothetical protein
LVIDPARKLDVFTWSNVSRFAFHPARADIVAATRGREVIVQRIFGGELSRSPGALVAGSFAPDGSRLAIAAKDRVALLDGNDFHALASLPIANAKSVAHGENAIAAHDGSSLHVFGVDGRKRFDVSEEKVQSTHIARYFFRGATLFIVTVDGSVTRRDATSGAALGDDAKVASAPALSNDGAFACEDGRLVRRADDQVLYVQGGTLVTASGAYEGSGDGAFVRTGDAIAGKLLALSDRSDLRAPGLKRAFFEGDALPVISIR